MPLSVSRIPSFGAAAAPMGSIEVGIVHTRVRLYPPRQGCAGTPELASHVRFFVRRYLFAAVLLALAGCGQERAGDDTRWVEYRDDARGFSVRYPPDWHRADERLTPRLADPTEVLSVGTFPLRPGGERCSHMPVRALEDFEPTDAFLSIQERAEPGRGEFQPRPVFRAPTDLRTGRFCVPDPQRADEWLFFSDNGRGFYAIVALGTDASPQTRSDLVEVLNSLEFEPRA
jgi:hypothetical protein